MGKSLLEWNIVDIGATDLYSDDEKSCIPTGQSTRQRGE